VVLCCADHRADPAHVLGIAPHEAVVIRNPGGRVTDSFLRELLVLATVAAVEGLDPGFELIVMHHTDCGLSHLSAETHAGVLAPMFGIDATEIADRHLADPFLAVAADIELLRENPFVPGTLVASGLVYDIDSGRITSVVAPNPLRAA
jgi:carbonic anhydrase